MRVAVIDDWQRVARASADWSALEQRAEVVFRSDPFPDANAVIAALADADIVLAMRERTAFPRGTIERLSKLKMLSFTGARVSNFDFDACRERGVVVCNTGGERSGASTAELALGLLIAAARSMVAGERGARYGSFQQAIPAGIVLEGRTLGLLGLGRIGSRVARYGQALGMDVIAWSPNLTSERASAAGVRAVDKDTLFATSDAISVHLVLAPATAKIVAAPDLARMKPGAIIVNTSRSGLLDTEALVSSLRAGRIVAGLDVFDEEPLPAGDPLTGLANVVLTPHIGYCAVEVYTQFHRESVENCLAFLDGSPIRRVA